jgi:hypothetical protein
MTYLSAKAWKNNAELIAEVAALYRFDECVGFAIDLTYNTGKWWKKWKPKNLVANDIDQRYGAFHEDYRERTGWDDGFFDLVAYDPPYQSQGGRKTSTVPGMNDAYGRDLSAKSPAENQEWINLGLTEAVRICRPGGYVLCKTMDYRSSGKLWLGNHWTLTHALTLPVEVEAIYRHVTEPGPQPKLNPDGSDRPQLSPRNNSSTLYLFRKTNNKEANNG